MLVDTESPLQCLDLDAACIRLDMFRTLLTAAASKRTSLERLVIRNIGGERRSNNGDNFDALEAAIPSLKVKELVVILVEEPDEEREKRLIEAIKRNYTIQSMQCTRTDNAEEDEYGYPLFTDANQARLNFFLNRNQKLAQWIENPKLVPRELWHRVIFWQGMLDSTLCIKACWQFRATVLVCEIVGGSASVPKITIHPRGSNNVQNYINITPD